MAITRAAAETLTAVIARTRLLCSDEDTADERWTDAQYTTAIQDALKRLAVEKGAKDSSPMRTADMTYTASAVSTALPAAALYKSIVKVENIDDADNPRPLEYVPAVVLETTRTDHWGNKVGVWTLLSDATTEHIAIRVKPDDALNLRIWYIDDALIPGVAADNLPIAPRWLRLVSLCSAKMLRSIENEWTQQQEEELMVEMKLFRSESPGTLGPRFIPTRRRI